MAFTSYIQSAAIKSLSELYAQQFSEKDFQINETKPEFKGDYTIVLFALVKSLKKSIIVELVKHVRWQLARTLATFL